MAVQLPNGVTMAIATALAAPITITAVTNANPAVATATAHGLSNGDIVVVTSGWSRLNNRVLRVSGSAANTFNYEGYDSSSTATHPIGTGIGTVTKITTLTQITQVLETTSSGGEMQFATFSFLENDFETQLPTQASAQSISMTIADDPSLAGYIARKNAAVTRALTALRLQMPNGSVLYYNGYISFDETPTMTKNQVMSVSSTFSLAGRPIRYAS
jgi:hypothetical protein